MKYRMAFLLFCIFPQLYSQETRICYNQTDSLYGFCRGGSVIVDYQYTAYDIFALVNDRVLVHTKEKIGITDNHGKIIVPLHQLYGDYMTTFNWDGDLYAYGSDAFQMVNDDGLMGIYNVNGDLLFDFKYEFVDTRPYHCLDSIDYRYMVKKGTRYTFRTKEDQPLTGGLVFDHALGYWHKTDTYVVLRNDTVLFIDLCDGRWSYSSQSRDINPFEKFYHNGKAGLISRSGKVVIDFEFAGLRYYGGSRPTFAIYREHGQGIADTNGVEIIPAIYDTYDRFCSNEVGNDIGHPFLAKKGEYYALLVYSGNEKKFTERTDFIFKRLDCRFDRSIGAYINHVETREGKKGVLQQDGTIDWEE